jgi:hypothetical protein
MSRPGIRKSQKRFLFRRSDRQPKLILQNARAHQDHQDLIDGDWRGISAVLHVCRNTRSQLRKQIFSISGSP